MTALDGARGRASFDSVPYAAPEKEARRVVHGFGVVDVRKGSFLLSMPHGRSISFQFGSEFHDLTARRLQGEQVPSGSELGRDFTTLALEIHPLSFKDPAASTSSAYFNNNAPELISSNACYFTDRWTNERTAGVQSRNP